MAQTNNALPTLKPKDDKHNIFNDGKERTIRYVEWKDEMKTKARSCAKNHGIKVLMGEMTDIPTGTTAAKKKERFELRKLLSHNCHADFAHLKPQSVFQLSQEGREDHCTIVATKLLNAL